MDDSSFKNPPKGFNLNMEQTAINFTCYFVGTVDFAYRPIAYRINIFKSTDYSGPPMVFTNHTDFGFGYYGDT